uniref:ThiF domain-containing protein n=1 Tax=Macrostomum lignano TaxID=282301 RepID=A0A1I8FSU1_9PLAT
QTRIPAWRIEPVRSSKPTADANSRSCGRRQNKSELPHTRSNWNRGGSSPSKSVKRVRREAAAGQSPASPGPADADGGESIATCSHPRRARDALISYKQLAIQYLLIVIRHFIVAEDLPVLLLAVKSFLIAIVVLPTANFFQAFFSLSIVQHSSAFVGRDWVMTGVISSSFSGLIVVNVCNSGLLEQSVDWSVTSYRDVQVATTARKKLALCHAHLAPPNIMNAARGNGYEISDKKHKKVSPTTLFLREYRSINPQYSRCPISDPNLVAEAMEAYRCLPPDQLDKLRQLAREENAAAAGGRVVKPAADSVSVPLAAPTATPPASEQVAKLIASVGSLADWPIVFGSVSVHLKSAPTYNAPLLPAELALVRYSQPPNGVSASVNSLPNIVYEDVPMGLMARIGCQSNANLPSPTGRPCATRLEAALGAHSDQPFLRVFAPRDKLADFAQAVDWLYSRAGRLPPACLTRPLPVEVLLRCLAEHLGNLCVVTNENCRATLEEHVATRKLATSRYNYAASHACSFHNQIDCPWLCTLHEAHVAAWVFSTELCPTLNLAITASHLPADPPLQLAAGSGPTAARRGRLAAPAAVASAPPNLPPGPDSAPPPTRCFAFGRGSAALSLGAPLSCRRRHRHCLYQHRRRRRHRHCLYHRPPSPSVSSVASSASVNVIWRPADQRPGSAASSRISTAADGIDDSLYSRQRYVMGDAAMQRMAAARVLVCGLDGLGVELAKNLALTGVRLLAVQDSRLCTAEDLGDQFFVTADDVANGAARDSASCPRLAELNPYVRIERHSGNVELPDESLGYIAEFDCVALVGASVDAQRRVSAACRTKRIPLVCAAVHGLFGCLFNDFGDVFQVNEPAAEEPREEFVASIDAAAGCVRTLDGRPHRLCVGDFVAFREIRGANRLNSGQWRVTATPEHDAFCIEAEQADLAGYECGGSFVLRVQPVQLQFRPLEHFLDGGPAAEGLSEALVMPDLGKDRAPLRLHCLHLALLRLGFNASAEALASEALACLRQADTPTPEDAEFVRRLARAAAAGGRLQPMCALFGGLAAQEVLKALTAKFTPFRQWLYLDAVELFGDDAASTLPTLTAGAEPRYHRLAACMGAGPVEQARRLRLFLVGCGAIGCELLKNFALCGFCTADGGRLTATDDDVIEKSNLNRQFLFRPGHIRQSKSLVAADVARRMNPSLSVEGLQLRVGRDTERTAFTDAFICRQDACVNALDNVAARRYMDQRCLANQRPLFESGTMGARGHVQVILPFISESYGAQQDPTEEEQVPYCTLKTFPQRIEHCIEWARDKFESSFACKPALVARLLDANGNSPRNIAKRLAADEHVPDAADAFRYLRQRPTSWPDCVQLAGKKFAKYFIHRALHILRAFPPDTRLPDGTPFWSPPKRPPRPVALNANEPL